MSLASRLVLEAEIEFGAVKGIGFLQHWRGRFESQDTREIDNLMLGLRSDELVSFVTLLFSIGGSVGVLDKFSAIQVCCSQEVQAASSR